MALDASPALLGIDLGTSSVKVVVLDLDGSGARGRPPRPTRCENPGPGWSETDPALWWRAVVEAVREATGAAGTPVAIGLSGQMHGLVATAADGRAVRPAMLWSDSRAVDQLAAYRALPEARCARLGNPLTPGMAGPMLAWLAEHEPQTYAATRWALQPKDWLRARLTGQFAAEPSDASATLLYDVLGDCWDTEVVAALGLDAGLLAPLLGAAGEPAGELLTPAAAGARPAAGHPGRGRGGGHRGRGARLRAGRGRQRAADHRHRRPGADPDAPADPGRPAGRCAGDPPATGRPPTTGGTRWPPSSTADWLSTGYAGCSAPRGRSSTPRPRQSPPPTTRCSCRT